MRTSVTRKTVVLHIAHGKTSKITMISSIIIIATQIIAMDVIMALISAIPAVTPVATTKIETTMTMMMTTTNTTHVIMISTHGKTIAI